MEIAEIKVSYSNNLKDTVQISDSNSAYKVLLESWNKDTLELQEEFKVILLNRNNKALGIYNLSKGGTSSTTVDIKLIFAVALKSNAHSIILGHNHPSGNLKPSDADKNITAKIKKAGQYLDISLLDHLIITKTNYYSFSDKGIL